MFMTQPILGNSMYTISDEVEGPSINKMGGSSDFIWSIILYRLRISFY